MVRARPAHASFLTRARAAPEVLEYRRYSHKSDVYSFGICTCTQTRLASPTLLTICCSALRAVHVWQRYVSWAHDPSCHRSPLLCRAFPGDEQYRRCAVETRALVVFSCSLQHCKQSSRDTRCRSLRGAATLCTPSCSAAGTAPSPAAALCGLTVCAQGNASRGSS